MYVATVVYGDAMREMRGLEVDASSEAEARERIRAEFLAIGHAVMIAELKEQGS